MISSMKGDVEHIAERVIGPDWRSLLRAAVGKPSLSLFQTLSLIQAVEAIDRIEPGLGRTWLERWAGRKGLSDHHL